MAQCWGEGVGEISQNRDELSWPDARMSEAVQWKPGLKCFQFPGNPLLNLTITYKQHSLSFDGHGFEFGGKDGGGRQHFIIKEFL